MGDGEFWYQRGFRAGYMIGYSRGGRRGVFYTLAIAAIFIYWRGFDL